MLDERRIHGRASPDDPVERLNEVVHVGDVALQQITAALSAGQEIHRVLYLDMIGENHDRGLRKLLPDHPCRVEALGRVARWHPDVYDD